MAGVPVDPISAVATAAGSMFDFGSKIFGGKKERKLETLQFEHTKKLAGIGMTNMILENRYAEKESTRNSKSAGANQKRLLTNGILIFVAVLVLVLVFTQTKNTSKK